MTNNKIEIDWNVPRWTVPPEAENHALRIDGRWVGHNGHLFEHSTGWEARAGLLIGKSTDGSSAMGTSSAWAAAAKLRDAKTAVGIDWDEPIVEFGPGFWPFEGDAVVVRVDYELDAEELFPTEYRWETTRSSAVCMGKTTDGGTFSSSPCYVAQARANR